MTAQLADVGGAPRPLVRVAKNLKAVRAALPEDQRAQFDTEIATGPMPETFERWWMRAIEATAPSIQAAYARIAAGTWSSTPAEEFFGENWTRRAV
jgi:hypothetical protein